MAYAVIFLVFGCIAAVGHAVSLIPDMDFEVAWTSEPYLLLHDPECELHREKQEKVKAE